MEQVGAFEAKTHLSKLLGKVTRGEKIVITKHGIPIALLTPYNEKQKYASSNTIQQLKRFRKGKNLGGLKVKTMIEADRD